ncbi:uncharacterized protein LOC134802940 [Cydia splendana]|uniref:uncharacterized protein LOC134802940 n=1 Tax=Cydia splendana TaxID=1100963 RepID=UPI0028F4991F
MWQRRGSFLILICKHIILLTGVLRQTVTKQLPQEAYQFQGYVPSRQPTTDPKLISVHRQKELLVMSAADIIHGTNPMIWRTAEIRMRSDQCASFEVGFVFKTLEETYKKMLDLYNTTVQIRKNNTNIDHMDHMMFLQKFEKLHWRIYHLHNMLHEVERKYKMDAIINASGVFRDGKRWTRPTQQLAKTFVWPKRTTSWWRPMEYGWNTDYFYW